jgi:hypothetical protein
MHPVLFDNQTSLFMMTFEKSWRPLHSEATNVINDPSVKLDKRFFFLFSSISTPAPLKFQSSYSIFFFRIWFIFFLLISILFGIIYKIKVFFFNQSHFIFFFFQIWFFFLLLFVLFVIPFKLILLTILSFLIFLFTISLSLRFFSY